MTISGWTEERVELLKKLWDAGLSSSQIAAELGNVTRNAVIGKIHRAGWQRTKKPVRRAVSKPPVVRTAPFRQNTAAVQPRSVETIAPSSITEQKIAPAARPCSLINLQPADCHWPIGDPIAADFHFCGGVAVVGRPYCAAHDAIAYQPLTQRRISPVISDAERVRRANHARAVNLSRTKGGGYR